MMLAQLQPDVNWPVTVQAGLGLIGLLMIVWLVLSVSLGWKKMFGRRPPINEELDKLESKLTALVLESFTRSYSASVEAKAEAQAVRNETRQKFEALNQEWQRALAGIN